MTALLEANDLIRRFRTPAGPVLALDGVSMEVAAGTMVAVTGPSGSGKSTLLRMLATLDEPTSGTVLLDGRDVASWTEPELLELRRQRIGYVFQDFGLLDDLSAAENVELPLRIARRPAVERTALTEAILETVELTPHSRQRPAQLSGGQRQRVAVARALVTAPDILVADEPTAQLDSRTAETITGLLLGAAHGRGAAVVVASHDEALLERADRVIRLRAGRLDAVDGTTSSAGG